MPFEKGKSGNPLGRPRLPKELTEQARSYTPEVLEALARTAIHGKTLVPVRKRIKRRDDTGKLLKSTTGQQLYDWEETGEAQIGVASPDLQIRAQELLLERALGKPVQTVAGPEMDQPLQIDRIERVIIHMDSDPPMKEINPRPMRERIINGNGREH